MEAPCSDVPLPAGKPAPSGSTSMSHAAKSAAVIGLPRLTPCASAPPVPKVIDHRPASSRILCIRMSDLSLLVDGPARDGVEVMIFERQERRHRRQLTARRNKFRARRLRVAVLVPGAALQHCRTAIPLPRHAETRERHAKHGFLQRGFAPALAAV